jgi:primosomal protein N'
MELTNSQLAALRLPSILMEVILKSKETWKCKYCSSETTILSEFCDNCGIEELEGIEDFD